MSDFNHDREHGEPFDMPTALDILHRIAKPLKGGRIERVSKSIYTSPQTTSLKAARLAAEALIERRKGERAS